MSAPFTIRDLAAGEAGALGRLLVDVYSRLEGFPPPAEQPAYYDLLANVGRFTEIPGARVLVALADDATLAGGVVCFGDMAHYGSGGLAPRVRNASGIRLLAVSPSFRSRGAGKALTRACIGLARERGHREVILHTTEAMRLAWGMYERLGFVRSEDLDFTQQGLPVYGFRLDLERRES